MLEENEEQSAHHEGNVENWDGVTECTKHWNFQQVLIQQKFTGHCQAVLSAPPPPPPPALHPLPLAQDSLGNGIPGGPLGILSRPIKMEIFSFFAHFFKSGKQKTENDALKECYQKTVLEFLSWLSGY